MIAAVYSLIQRSKYETKESNRDHTSYRRKLQSLRVKSLGQTADSVDYGGFAVD